MQEMVNFLDLPVEILPLITSHVVKPHHLTEVCLVNKTFHNSAIPQLYERAAIYAWHRDGKTKVIQLFRTLASCPHLAKHIRQLEIREFPKASIIHREDLISTIIQGLSACIHLYSCTWTRDGSISSKILRTLAASPTLRELEINGWSYGVYDPSLLGQFKTLSKFTLIMPDRFFVRQLSYSFENMGGRLQSLKILCNSSLVITDDVLESLAPNLTNLKQLQLTGCPKVTHTGVWSILSRNTVGGLQVLGLQSLSTHFDMATFSLQCLAHNALSNLLSATLTLPSDNPHVWTFDVYSLLSESPLLQHFHVNSTELVSSHTHDHLNAPSSPSSSSPSLTWSDDFWSRIVTRHGKTLVRFSVLFMSISPRVIEEICIKCVNLKELFISVELRSFEGLMSALSRCKNLRSLHINWNNAKVSRVQDYHLSPSEALEVVRGCSPTLIQFGFNTSIWQVSRRIEVGPDGTLDAYPELRPYENPDIPEAFQIIRQ